jgi:hypothetical protein
MPQPSVAHTQSYDFCYFINGTLNSSPHVKFLDVRRTNFLDFGWTHFHYMTQATEKEHFGLFYEIILPSSLFVPHHNIPRSRRLFGFLYLLFGRNEFCFLPCIVRVLFRKGSGLFSRVRLRSLLIGETFYSWLLLRSGDYMELRAWIEWSKRALQTVYNAKAEMEASSRNRRQQLAAQTRGAKKYNVLIIGILRNEKRKSSSSFLLLAVWHTLSLQFCFFFDLFRASHASSALDLAKSRAGDEDT